jgi:hypothetical protein
LDLLGFTVCDAVRRGYFGFLMLGTCECISPVIWVAVVSSVVKHEFSWPLAFDYLCNCCGIMSRMGKSGVYITLSMTNMMVSLFSWCILSCMVPLPRAVRPPDMPFSVVP